MKWLEGALTSLIDALRPADLPETGSSLIVPRPAGESENARWLVWGMLLRGLTGSETTRCELLKPGFWGDEFWLVRTYIGSVGPNCLDGLARGVAGIQRRPLL
jgi:hypothetical protein